MGLFYHLPDENGKSYLFSSSPRDHSRVHHKRNNKQVCCAKVNGHWPGLFKIWILNSKTACMCLIQPTWRSKFTGFAPYLQAELCSCLWECAK